MKRQIWRNLAQLLSNRKDLAQIIKPFFENLKNSKDNDEEEFDEENFNDDDFLRTLTSSQLNALYESGILTFNPRYSLELEQKFQRRKFLPNIDSHNNEIISTIILGDNLDELRELHQKKDINTFNIITASFREIDYMKIPIIQFCIMKNAIKCFKYLLVNGIDDPNKIMEELYPDNAWDYGRLYYKQIHRYQWDSMATAIYFGNNEIIKILESKGFIIGSNPAHIEAAILSFRQSIAKEIIQSTNGVNTLVLGLCASANSNNIEIAKFILKENVDINAHDSNILNN